MSYGYPGQGGQYPANDNSRSFGVPPGPPTAPGDTFHTQNSNYGFANTPQQTFGMPQPFTEYPQTNYPTSVGLNTQFNMPIRPPPPYSGNHSVPYPQQIMPQPFSSEQSFQGHQQAMPQPLPSFSNILNQQQTIPQPSSCYPSLNNSQVPYPSQYNTFNSNVPGHGNIPNRENSLPQTFTSHHNQQQSFYSNQQQQQQQIPSYDGTMQHNQNNTRPSMIPPHEQSRQMRNFTDLGQGKIRTSSVALASGGYVTPGQVSSTTNPACNTLSYQTLPAAPKLSPTAVPYPNFDPRADAEVLRKAMKGFGTDEKAIINVLANRSNLQRQEIALQFKTLYGKDLIKDLKSELSGKFEDLIVAMMTPLPEFYVKELHHAMAGMGTDECVLIEVMCTMSNHEIRVIRQIYEQTYCQSLENALKSETSGNFKRLMVSLCCGNRDESYDIDHNAAREDARKLLLAGELKVGTDESTFNTILVQRNVRQLQLIFQEYFNVTGHSIEDAINREFSGDIKKGLLAIVKVVQDRAGFFAEQLGKSMKGLGTEDRRLIRLVVTRSEIDMGEIKQAFIAKYGKSLEDYISGDCSGYYKKCLLALIS